MRNYQAYAQLNGFMRNHSCAYTDRSCVYKSKPDQGFGLCGCQASSTTRTGITRWPVPAAAARHNQHDDDDDDDHDDDGRSRGHLLRGWLKACKIVGGALRVGSGGEDRALVGLEGLEPRGDTPAAARKGCLDAPGAGGPY
jgi:hypothetical protein